MKDKQVRLSNIGVRRDSRYDGLVKRLCTGGDGFPYPVFQYIKDLMVFAALVGYNNKKMIPIPVGADTISITLETYSTDQNDSFIYLLALMQSKDPHCLKDKNLLETIKVFESYCNGGLEIINNWFIENPSEPDILNIILDKIYDQVIRNSEVGNKIANEDIEVEF